MTIGDNDNDHDIITFSLLSSAACKTLISHCNSPAGSVLLIISHLHVIKLKSSSVEWIFLRLIIGFRE